MRPTLFTAPALAVALVMGCAAKPSTQGTSQQAPTAPISNADPCAGRLHDISGVFLLYLLQHRDLPLTLDQLTRYARQMGVGEFVCPVSGLPYVYQKDGILLPEQNARVILYDASPAHSGYRWAIVIGAPSPDQPPRTKVIALPESFFLLRPPGS